MAVEPSWACKSLITTTPTLSTLSLLCDHFLWLPPLLCLLALHGRCSDYIDYCMNMVNHAHRDPATQQILPIGGGINELALPTEIT
jgi:hypothetical protein